ncbi:MAG: MFS transporter [Candidatus Hydrogenedentota bacterium]|nr:MAG: MFS transporter [Candidatus Hydrogenedentota bacterium]
MSVAFVGTACGGMVMSPLANWFIVNYSWRVAFALAGVEILALVLPTIYFLIRTRPSEMGLEPYRDAAAETAISEEAWGVDVRDAFSMPVFWQISAIILIVALVTAGVGYHCVAYLTDLGHSPDSATFAWSMVMGVMILGKIVTGPVADRWGAKNTTAAACVLFSLSIVILTLARSYPVAILFAVVYGFTLGAPLVLNPLLTGDYLGMKNFGTIFAIFNVMGTIGGNVGPIAAGIFFDRQKTYLPVFYVFAVLMVLAVVCSILIKPLSESSGAAGQPQSADAAG